MKHMLDLFSGFGGASEAMVQDSKWSVLRIENNPLLGGVPYTVIEDVKNLKPNPPHSNLLNAKIDLIWASPPCREFSGGFNSPKSIWSRENGLESYKPNMDLLLAAIEIIEKVKPKYWIIENVVGSIRYFEEYLGEPRQIIGPYVLWGNFPILDCKPEMIMSKSGKDVHSSNPLRINYKAKVDIHISRTLKETIESQQSIFDY
tara:strand:- start:901 stop:1509 length:609 start_codon:yes stop_codon:yes gene_type:complete